MFNKGLQLTIFLLLTAGSEARQQTVVQELLIEEELEAHRLVPTPGPHHHQVGGLRANEGSSPFPVLRNVVRGEGGLVPSQAQSGQEGEKCL